MKVWSQLFNVKTFWMNVRAVPEHLYECKRSIIGRESGLWGCESFFFFLQQLHSVWKWERFCECVRHIMKWEDFMRLREHFLCKWKGSEFECSLCFLARVGGNVWKTAFAATSETRVGSKTVFCGESEWQASLFPNYRPAFALFNLGTLFMHV